MSKTVSFEELIQGAPAAATDAAGLPAPAASATPSGTPARRKGPGFLGTLMRPDGGVSTELSIGVDFDGKETEIPSLVPTLTQQEIDHMLSGAKPTDAIVGKAVAHARQRIAGGKDPFATIADPQRQFTAVQTDRKLTPDLDDFEDAGVSFDPSTQRISTRQPMQRLPLGLRFAVNVLNQTILNKFVTVGEKFPPFIPDELTGELRERALEAFDRSYPAGFDPQAGDDAREAHRQVNAEQIRRGATPEQVAESTRRGIEQLLFRMDLQRFRGLRPGQKRTAAIPLEPREGAGELVVDTAAGIAAFIAHLTVARRIAGRSLPKTLTPLQREMGAWSLAFAARGENPIKGAGMALALGAISQAPVGSIGPVKAAAVRTAATSGMFAAITKAEGGSAVDIAVAASIPAFFLALGATQRMLSRKLSLARNFRDVIRILGETQAEARRAAAKILGVKPDATPEQITKAFRDLAKQTHPDIAGPKSAVEFRRAQAARDFLLGKTDRFSVRDFDVEGTPTARAETPQASGTPAAKPASAVRQTAIAEHLGVSRPATTTLRTVLKQAASKPDAIFETPADPANATTAAMIELEQAGYVERVGETEGGIGWKYTGQPLREGTEDAAKAAEEAAKAALEPATEAAEAKPAAEAAKPAEVAPVAAEAAPAVAEAPAPAVTPGVEGKVVGSPTVTPTGGGLQGVARDADSVAPRFRDSKGDVVLFQGVRAGNLDSKQGRSPWFTQNLRRAISFATAEGEGGVVRMVRARDMPEGTFVAEGEAVSMEAFLDSHADVGTIVPDEVPVIAEVPVSEASALADTGQPLTQPEPAAEAPAEAPPPAAETLAEEPPATVAAQEASEAAATESSKPVDEVLGLPTNRGATPHEIDTGRLPAATDAPTGRARPIAAGTIIRSMEAEFGIPIRGKATHATKGALGWYEARDQVVRQEDVRAITTGTHEVGHHINAVLGEGDKKFSSTAPAAIAQELRALGKALYGDTKPVGGYASEGFAEFIRMTLTGQQAELEQGSPNTWAWYQNDFIPNNKKMFKSLEKTRKQIDKFRGQGSLARTRAFRSGDKVKDPLSVRIRRLGLWADTAFRDELAPLRSAMRRAGIEEGELRPSEDPYELAVAFADTERAVAEHFVLHRTTDMAGEDTGPGLSQVLAPVEGRLQEFADYIVALRSLDLWDRGINPGLSRTDAEFTVSAFDSPEWRQVAKDVTDWNHRALDYSVEAGAIEPKAADLMKKLNPIYVPFTRAFVLGEISGSGSGASGGLLQQGAAQKGIKGSGREISDPFFAMIANTTRLVAISHKAAVGRALVNLSKTRPALGSMIVPVPAPKVATTFTADRIKKDVGLLAVRHLGLDAESIDFDAFAGNWDEILTIYSNAQTFHGKENIVSVVTDGKRQFFEVDRDLFRVLQGLETYRLPAFLDFFFGKANRALRLGATGLNAAFGLIRNFARDAATFTVQAEFAKAGPFSALGGIIADVRRTPAAQKFKALGGKQSGFIGQDRSPIGHLQGHDLATSSKGKVIKTVAHPVHAMRELFGITEAGTRIGEFQAALKEGERRWGEGSLDAAIFALNAAQDVTTNFTRHGRIGKMLNQVIAFFNAAIQGPDKMIRTFRKRPKRAIFSALAYLTLPAIFFWWRNKDEEWYENLPRNEKVNYTHIEVPDKDLVLRLPVPFLLGHIFQSVPVALLDQAYGDDPKAVKETLGVAMKEANPFAWPSAVAPAIDVLQNEDFAGRPIVPVNVEGKLPQDQVKPHTTQIMRIIGREIGVSPAKLEHLVDSYSGGLYRRTSTFSERLLGLARSQAVTSDLPIIGTLFLRDAFAPKAQIAKFYARLDELSQLKQSGLIAEPDEAERADLAKRGRALTPLWKELRDATTTAERKRIYAQVGSVIESGVPEEGTGGTRTRTQERTRERARDHTRD